MTVIVKQTKLAADTISFRTTCSSLDSLDLNANLESRYSKYLIEADSEQTVARSPLPDTVPFAAIAKG